ncbi:MAG: class I SAM-dependent methyltransferase [Bacteroidota bacterium]
MKKIFKKLIPKSVKIKVKDRIWSWMAVKVENIYGSRINVLEADLANKIGETSNALHAMQHEIHEQVQTQKEHFDQLMQKINELKESQTITEAVQHELSSLVNKHNKYLNEAVEKLNKIVNDDYKNKINKLNVLVYNMLPEEMMMNETVTITVQKFLKKHKVLPNLNLVISKNDLMFQYDLLHIHNLKDAYIGYLSTGLNSMNLLRKLIIKKFGELSKIERVLDFASGYGRLTRFLALEINPKNIWVSDIKENSVLFQKEQFKVNGITSSYVPEEFIPGVNFDMIYVGSLFSHLPEDLFKRWLRVLFDLITDRGVLAITVHDIKVSPAGPVNEIQYYENNEDILFSEINDAIIDKRKYGIAFVSENFLKSFLNSMGIQNNQIYRYPKALARNQDLYVITKESDIYDNTLNFDNYP